MAIQFHELAHLVLHPDSTITRRREAEADGFAIGMLTIADLSEAPTAHGVLPYAAAEAAFRSVPKPTQPRADCRLEPLHFGLHAWYRERPDLNSPPELKRRSAKPDDAAVRKLIPQKSLCREYDTGFDSGVKSAFALVTAYTPMNVSDPIMGLTCGE